MTRFLYHLSSRLRIGLVLLPIAAPAALAEGAAMPGEQSPSADPVAAAVAQANPTPLQWRPSLSDLARSASFVFRGRVSEQTSERDPRGLIFTRTRFEVAEVLIGAPETRSVTLTTLGGRVGSEVMTATHVPRFVPGPTYIVFTEPSRPTNSTYFPRAEPGRPIGNENGVFIVDATRNIVRTATGRVVLGVGAETCTSEPSCRQTGRIPGQEPAANRRRPSPGESSLQRRQRFRNSSCASQHRKSL